jgi:hypothetical protein
MWVGGVVRTVQNRRKQSMAEYFLFLLALVWDQLWAFCEHGSKHSVYIKGKEILDILSRALAHFSLIFPTTLFQATFRSSIYITSNIRRRRI